MILVPILALVLAALGVYFLKIHVGGEASPYIAVAFVAGLDTVCGGYRSGLEEKFRNDVFWTGFVSNTAIAFLFAWLGDRIGVNLYLVAALVLGQRIFVNLSVIRRILLTKIQDERVRKKHAKEQVQAQAAQNAASQSQATP